MLLAECHPQSCDNGHWIKDLDHITTKFTVETLDKVLVSKNTNIYYSKK